MTAFIIVCIALFIISIVSNGLFILNNNTEFKAGALIGIIVFSGMTAWALSLLF